jgi:vacuolar-type H+-ATPase subunit I/STV1
MSSKGPWAQSAIDHLLRKAVPGPYHVVRDVWGDAYISGAPDRIWCNDETIELAVAGLERFRAEADRDQSFEEEIEELKANLDEMEGDHAQAEKTCGELEAELDGANERIRDLTEELRDANERIAELEAARGPTAGR